MTALLNWLRHHWRLVRIGTMTGDQAFVEAMLHPCRCSSCVADRTPPPPDWHPTRSREIL